MHLLQKTTWDAVFADWRKREASEPGWIECATKVKGWPSWDAWRAHTAAQFSAAARAWSIWQFDDPMKEVPRMLVGPYGGWQSRLPTKLTHTFASMLDVAEQLDFVRENNGVARIGAGLPFPTMFIGLRRKDTGAIVCIEGHHRAAAVALAARNGKKIDFSGMEVRIALADLSAEEIPLLEKALLRGTTKTPPSTG